MKIAVLGLDFQQGKVKLKDPRLDKLKDLTKSPTKTYIQIDLVGQDKLAQADAIISTQEKKSDLIIDDLDTVEKRLAQTQEKDQNSKLTRMKEELDKENLLCDVKFEDDFIKDISDYNLLTLKPIYIIEQGLMDIDTILPQAYKKFGFISFFTTAGEKEARAWSISAGVSAYEAAGKVHSDIQRGFIRAEVINSEDLISVGSIHEAKNQNLIRIENKEYIVKDGDWINFKFSK